MQDKIRYYKSHESGQYDYTRLQEDTVAKQSPFGFCQYIAEKIRVRSRRDKKEEKPAFTRQTIAEETGMTINMVKGIINRKNITKKRDAIIAICRAIGLNVYDTNEALKRYPMPILDLSNMRDLIIIKAIRDGKDIDGLNASLRETKLGELDLSGRRIKDRGYENNYYSADELLGKKYECRWMEVKVFNEGKSIPEQTELSSLYAPDMFRYEAELELLRKSDGRLLTFTYPQSQMDDEILKKYGNRYDEELHLYDARLQNEIDEKMLYVRTMLDDTKFYGHRYLMEIADGELVIYGEWFNAEKPELEEYYQISIVGGRYAFSASKESEFLQRYLGHRYVDFYHPAMPNRERISGMQLKDVEELAGRQIIASLKPEPNREEARTLEHQVAMAERLRRYSERMVNGAAGFVERLKAREVVVFIPEDYEDVEAIFDLAGALEFVEDEQTGELVPQATSITLDDGTEVSVEELYRCLELGIYTLEEVRLLKAKYGEVDKVLKI